MRPSPARVTPAHPRARDRRADGRADGVLPGKPRRRGRARRRLLTLDRGGRLMRRLVLRGLLVLALDAIALLLLAAILPGFDVNGLRGAIVTAAIVGVLNALVWPTLSRLALPLSVVTLGLAGTPPTAPPAPLPPPPTPGRTNTACSPGVVGAAGRATPTPATSSMLAIDDDEAWMRNVVRRQARRR